MNTFKLFLLVSLLLGLSACGQKGDLYFPKQESAAAVSIFS